MITQQATQMYRLRVLFDLPSKILLSIVVVLFVISLKALVLGVV